MSQRSQTGVEPLAAVLKAYRPAASNTTSSPAFRAGVPACGGIHARVPSHRTEDFSRGFAVVTSTVVLIHAAETKFLAMVL